MKLVNKKLVNIKKLKISDPLKIKLLKKNKKINYHAKVQELIKDYKVVAIIPAYNEASRIHIVLNSVCNYPFIYEVVVVDDGSTDNTFEVVQNLAQTCNKIKLIKQPHNQGKASAMLKGFENVKDSDIVIFLDADLKQLPHEYLDKLLYYILDGEYDMTILDRLSDRQSPFGIFALARFFGGERALWVKDFKQIDFKHTQGYEIESTINLWYLKNNKRVRTIFAPKLHSAWQFKKWGTLKALKRYLDMFLRIYKKYGVRNFYLQVIEFDDETLEELYSWYKKHKDKKLLGNIARAVLTAGVVVGTVGVMFWALGYDLIKNSREKIKK